jgi:hypothetical protein
MLQSSIHRSRIQTGATLSDKRECLLLLSVVKPEKRHKRQHKRTQEAATYEYASFINKKDDQEDGVWTTGTVQCLYQCILPRACCQPTASCPTKVSPFRLWADATDSICGLPCLLTYWDNHPQRPEEAFVELLMVRQPLPPSQFLLSPTSSSPSPS